MRRLAAAIGMTMVVVLSAPVARAGGWWSSIDLDRAGSYVAPGQEVRATVEFLFPSIEAAESARDQRFFVYLIGGFDWSIPDQRSARAYHRAWSVDDATLVPLGELRLHGWDANLARATATVRIPDVPDGRYALMFCDAGCDVPLGDVTPAKVRVTHEPVAARVSERVQRLDEAMSRRLYALEAGLHERIRRAELQTETGFDELATALRAVEAAANDRDDPTVPWWSFLGWFVAGVATAAAVAARLIGRPARSERTLDSEAAALDEAVRRLVAEERVPAGSLRGPG